MVIICIKCFKIETSIEISNEEKRKKFSFDDVTTFSLQNKNKTICMRYET